MASLAIGNPVICCFHRSAEVIVESLSSIRIKYLDGGKGELFACIKPRYVSCPKRYIAARCRFQNRITPAV